MQRILMIEDDRAIVDSLSEFLKSEGYEILPIDADTPLIQHVSCNSVEE